MHYKVNDVRYGAQLRVVVIEPDGRPFQDAQAPKNHSSFFASSGIKAASRSSISWMNRLGLLITAGLIGLNRYVRDISVKLI